MIQAFLLFGSSLVLSLLLTPWVRHVAIRSGYVSYPKEDRWHQTPTALLGGIGIFIAFALPLVVFLGLVPEVLLVLGGASLVFGVGILDDFIHLQPYSKLIGQIVSACFVVGAGVFLGVWDFGILGILLSVLWIVGVTNAFNLLDNMDGLSAGIGSIAAFCLFLAGTMTGKPGVMLIALALCGSALGFLAFNFPPAKIFMGDSGSLILGFALSTLAIMGHWDEVTNVMFALLIPVLVLAVPIFDTAFVSMVRFFNGRAISQGGRDHTSHRLVTFGLSERTTVLLFYTLSMICGIVGVMGLKFGWLYPGILAMLIVIVFWYLGVFLNGVVSYGERAKNLTHQNSGLALSLFLMEKRRIGEVFLDSLLIAFSFVIAFLIRFDGLPPQYEHVVAQSLPLLVPLKLVVFFYFGLYRGIWRYVGIQDLLNIVKAVSLSSALSVVLMTMVFRFESYSRAVFSIDWMVLLLAVSGVRVAIRLIREYLRSWVSSAGKRLLIIGAGDAGEIALREIRNNLSLGYLPIGFVDDDRNKVGRKIHGVPVMGTRQELANLVRDHGIEEILVAIPSAKREILGKILQDCKKTGTMTQVLSRTRKLASPASA